MPLQNIQYSLFRPLLIAASVVVVSVTMPSAAEEPVSGKIAARVNGIPVYASALPPASESRIKQYAQLGSKVSPEELRRRFQLKELDALVDNELLVQAGAGLKTLDIEEKLAKRLASLKDKSGKKGTDSKDVDEALKESLRREILKESYLEQKGLLNPKVDEDTLRRFYDENRKSFAESKAVKASHILVRLPKTPTPEQELEARGRAEKVLAELKMGKEFASLAREKSDCNSKSEGGSLGFVKQGFMPKEFDAAAFSLKPGETSGIVKTRHGFHIIRVEETKPEITREFVEVKEQIAGYLRKDYQRRKVDEHVQELRKTARIEILM